VWKATKPTLPRTCPMGLHRARARLGRYDDADLKTIEGVPNTPSVAAPLS
jgi:hypothetical protein